MSSPLYKKMTCWKGYVAKGKKKSPSGKKTKSGKVKMVNNCVKKSPAKQLQGEELVDFTPPEMKGGSAVGMFAIPMGIYNRYQDHKNHLAEQGPQSVLDKSKIEAMKYNTSADAILPEDNTGSIDAPLTKKKRKKKPDVRKTTKGKGRNFRTTEEGAGMTAKGVANYKKKNPGSKLKTAVTGKVKPGSKAAKRRKSFCARSKGWTGERGKAARRRWKC
tara:strand:- start:1228 stop:1881 length:654 start_codon:yes stop_codon:yes gene_type:complete